jgi:hypothetical protein
MDICHQPFCPPAQQALLKMDQRKRKQDYSQRGYAHNPKGTLNPFHRGHY